MSMMALGIMHFVHTQTDTVLDLIPCDFVSNAIIAQSVYTAKAASDEIKVVHATTSSKNPIRILEIIDQVQTYTQKNPFYRKGHDGKVWVITTGNHKAWRTAMYITTELPLILMQRYYRIRGDERQVSKLQKMMSMQQRMIENYDGFDHFTSNTWQFMQNKSDMAWNIMSEDEKREFNFDVTSIDWRKAEHNFLFGIRRFFFKEDILPPQMHFKQLLEKEHARPFVDLRTAYKGSQGLIARKTSDHFEEILSSANFNAFLEMKSHMPATSMYHTVAAKKQNKKQSKDG